MHEHADGLERLYDPRSVAVVGASNNIGKWGFSTLLSILNGGFSGEVYPVNLTEETILGRKAYRRVSDISGEVDLAVLVVPSEVVPSVMEDCVEAGVKAAVVISAGFAEIGPEGRKLQESVVEIARRGGIRIVGPNCMGFWSASANLRAFMFPLPVLPGPLGLVSQGGNVGGALVHSAFERGIGFKKYVSCGCTADIRIEDYITDFARDPDIKVIMAYIEGIEDGRRFLEKVREVTATKPVIAMKPGKTTAAAEAIVSHSGSMSGSDDIYEAVFREAGVLRVDSADELLDLALGFLTQPLPSSRNVAIVTPGGSYGVVCADACGARGLRVVELSEETISEFDKLFPPRWSHRNPLDPAGDRNFISYLKAPAMLLGLAEVGSLIFMGFGSFSSLTTNLSFIEMAETSGALSLTPEVLDGLETPVRSFIEAVSAGDATKIELLLRPAFEAAAPVLGAHEGDDAGAFAVMVSSLLASGRVEFSMDDFESLRQAAGRGRAIEALQELASGLLDRLLAALVVSWIQDHGKPVVTTTFNETIPRLVGGVHISYPSGDRAAKVIAGMATYAEFLQRRTGEPPDPFAFALLG